MVMSFRSDKEVRAEVVEDFVQRVQRDLRLVAKATEGVGGIYIIEVHYTPGDEESIRELFRGSVFTDSAKH